MKIYYNISIPIPEEKTFTYYIDDEREKRNLVGYRVLVPFGKKKLTGVVTEKIPDTNISFDKSKIKEILEILDEEPFFTSQMLNFARWIAEYYIAPLGLVFKAFLPKGLSTKSIARIKICKSFTDEELRNFAKTSPKRYRLLKYLIEHPNYLSISYIKKTLKIKNISPQLEYLLEKGIIDYSDTISKQEKPRLSSAIELPEKDTLSFDELIKKYKIKGGTKQFELLQFLYSTKSKQVLAYEIKSKLQFSPAVLKSLQKKGAINIIKTETKFESLFTNELTSIVEKNYTLNEEQKACFEQILKAITTSLHQVFLLYGVTGSGKTLLYIKLIEEVLKRGKTAIVLVPEISLTPQLIDRFNLFFEGSIVVLHSKTSEVERYEGYRRIREGTAKIVIGARSAIFAPLQNIGIIIVDEEHEHTYKQTSSLPYYNAKDCAVVRGKIENAVVVLGSATPSIESMFNAKQDKYKLLQIINRADNAQLPDIRIIDLISAKRMGQVRSTFTKELVEEILERIQRQEICILFQNRRGFSPFMECWNCRYVPICKYCNVSLTYHKVNNKLICHYCGYSIDKPNTCPQCNSQNFIEVGYGTQRLEEQIKEILKDYGSEPRIGRMDSDTTTRKFSHRKILLKLYKKDYDILIGTQMIAKGLDFPNVTLVGVINADLLLYSPDFRASERTFQLLTQVAGRAGRSPDKKGLVIIQTTHPDNPVIKSVSIGSYFEFYHQELKNRELAKFPPFTRLVLIEFKSTSEDKVDISANSFFELLPKNSQYLIAYPPIIPTISKVMNLHRRIIIVKNFKDTDSSGIRMRKILRKALEIYSTNEHLPKVIIRIEVDAYSSF